VGRLLKDRSIGEKERDGSRQERRFEMEMQENCVGRGDKKALRFFFSVNGG
jgi:hypothetical protein